MFFENFSNKKIDVYEDLLHISTECGRVICVVSDVNLHANKH